MIIRATALLVLLSVVCAGASAQKRKISVAVSIGAFFPSSSAIRDEFGNSWKRVSLTTFDAAKPTHWRFIAEGGGYRLDGLTKARLTAVTFGAERGLRKRASAQPYVTLRAGPYWGRAEVPAAGFRESHTGLNVNTSFGIIFKHSFYAEIRYDYFSRFAGLNFDGLSLSAGIRLFDIRL